MLHLRGTLHNYDNTFHTGSLAAIEDVILAFVERR
jgi:hypothetical protein